jgi:hypothetical protein
MPIIVVTNGQSVTYPDNTNLSSIAGINLASEIIVSGSGTTVNTSSLASATALTTLVVQNGATLVDGGALANISTLSSLEINGGTYDENSSAINAKLLNSITIGPAGGNLEINASLVSLNLSSAITYVDANGNTTTTPPANFTLTFPNESSVSASYNGSTTTLTTGVLGIVAGSTITVTGNPFGLSKPTSFLGVTVPSTKTFTSSSGTVTVCFLAGALIETEHGPVAVEDIAIGDRIVAHVDGQDQLRSVIWAGWAHATVRPDLPDDEAGYPVRILQNAISDGVPCKDLLLTPEHCLFLNGKFTPARMLVNGRSIFYDHTITSYDYYHIETEIHSVIVANGLRTESYLDTGNRNGFQQRGPAVRIAPPSARTWTNDAAAPLAVSREEVEPLFDSILARAESAELGTPAPCPAVTDDADLHLVTDAGQIIRMARENSGRAMFMIPAGVGSVRIMSRTSRPTDVVGPFVDDRRHLGVLIGTVALFDSGETREIDTHLTDDALSGWDVQEQAPCRWTNGCATLPLGDRRPDSIGMLAITVLSAGPYLAASVETPETMLNCA